MNKLRLLVIGAGASGLIAAAHAAEAGAKVTILEKTGYPGNKIKITGQGRCNLSHTGSVADFIPRYNDGRFLYRAFNIFFNKELTALLNNHGLGTITEQDGRIFPASQKASDVVSVLMNYGKNNGVLFELNTRVTALKIESGAVIGVGTDRGSCFADGIILATGGCSYPATGSNGDGYFLARSAGHPVVPLRPAIVPLKAKEIGTVYSMQGAALRRARLTAFRLTPEEIELENMPSHDLGRGLGRKKAPAQLIESRVGEIIFTHFGLSGPAVLLMSLAVVDALRENRVTIAIDMVPDKSIRNTTAFLQALFNTSGKRVVHNILELVIPPKITKTMVAHAGIDPEKRGSQISSIERGRLVKALKCFRLEILGAVGMSSAAVTAGGVSLDSINPKTMESRLVRGLYFCGEVMDIDGDSGGYNLQAAFSTGYLAGDSAAHCFTKNSKHRARSV